MQVHVRHPDWCISPHANRPASLSHLDNDCPIHYRFFTFWPQGQPLGQSSLKGEMTCYPPRSTILPNFIALRQPTQKISLTRVFADKHSYTHTETISLNDISPSCLSACGDNKDHLSAPSTPTINAARLVGPLLLLSCNSLTARPKNKGTIHRLNTFLLSFRFYLLDSGNKSHKNNQ